MNPDTNVDTLEKTVHIPAITPEHVHAPKEHASHKEHKPKPEPQPHDTQPTVIPTLYTLTSSDGVSLLGKDKEGKPCYVPVSLLVGLVAKEVKRH